MVNKKEIETLIEADMRIGNDNPKAIKRHLQKEEYEELSVIKKVFDKNGKTMSNPTTEE